MYNTIETVIKSLGFPQAYLKAFQENELDDEFLASLDTDMALFKILADVIPPAARRHKFIQTLKTHLSGGAPRQTFETETYSTRSSSSSHAASVSGSYNNMGMPGSGAAYPATQLNWNAPANNVTNNAAVSNSGKGSVQIMEFEEVQRGGGSQTRKTIMMENEFRKVIDKCTPGAPVAVLAIAGKANKGKSLFLSYVLRYLKALESGQNIADWMGWNDKQERPLQEGFRWANGYNVVTKGIWTWSEPISIKNSKGQVFDVLLLDTQGVFDEETGQREWNILAGLSLLTSSLMILNTSNDVQEDTLESLQNFLSFGLLALDRDKSPEGACKPFQNLVFLVRDWENHQEFPYGNQGGKEFIQRKLQMKPQHDEFHRRLRNHMKDCFESINCFLFPFPGRATRESNFTGSVVNASADYRDFAQYVQQCIEQLLNPDRCPVKTMNGNVMTAIDVFEMFKSYVEIFNSDQLPSSSDLYNASADRCNAMIIARCLASFELAFESGLSSVPFLNEVDFTKMRETAEEEALARFEKSRKMGDKQLVNASKVELKRKLDEKVSLFMAINQNRLADAWKALEEKLSEILRDYEAKLESRVDENVVSPEAFNEIHSQMSSGALQKFQDLHCHPPLESEGLAVLDRQMQNVGRWLSRVKMNKEMAEQAFLTLADATAIEYWNELNSYNFKDLKEAEQAEAQARSTALKKLEGFPRKLDGEMIQKVKDDLTAQMDAMYKKTVGQLESNLSLEGDQAKAQEAVEDAVRRYRNSMEAHVSSASTSQEGLMEGQHLTDIPLSADHLSNFHGQCESDAVKYLSEFLEKNFENPSNAKILEQQSRAQLLLRISQELSNFQRLNDQKSKTLKVQVSKCISEVQQQFVNDLKQLTEQTLDASTFISMAADLKNGVNAKLEKFIHHSVLAETDLTDHLSALEAYMDDLVSLNVKVVDSKRKENEAAVRAKAQTEDLSERMERMQKEFEERAKKLAEATRAQAEAEKKRVELMQKETEEREQRLLEAARTEAEAQKERMELMQKEFEERQEKVLEEARAQSEAENAKELMERMKQEYEEREKRLLEAEKERMESMQKESEERQQRLLEAARAEAEKQRLQDRLDRMEREAQADRGANPLVELVTAGLNTFLAVRKPK